MLRDLFPDFHWQLAKNLYVPDVFPEGRKGPPKDGCLLDVKSLELLRARFIMWGLVSGENQQCQHGRPDVSKPGTRVAGQDVHCTLYFTSGVEGVHFGLVSTD